MIDKLIGGSPMVKIKYKYEGKIRNVYAKLEYYNYTGSIKDRLAMYIINKSKELGILKSGQLIVEATSGNTGISFAALGALYGHPVHIFMPSSASVERRKLLELYGAELHLVDSGFVDAIKEADRFALENDGFRPDQFSNVMNVEAHYFGTAGEIIKQVSGIEGFVSGVGTGGTLIGVGKRLKEFDQKIKVIALEPSNMPLLSGGEVKGMHKIEGIGDDFIPDIYDSNIIDDVISIDDREAINMSRMLAKRFGLGVGISSGANLMAAVLSGVDNVVTVFADDAKKYLSTDLLKEDDAVGELESSKVELLDIEVV